MKEWLSIFLTIVMVFTSATVAFGMEEKKVIPFSKEDVLADAEDFLSVVARDKEAFGMGDVDFNNLSLSTKIPMYEADGMAMAENIDVQYYGVLEEDKFIGLIISVRDDHGNSRIKFTRGFNDEINSLISKEKAICFVTEEEGLYLCSEQVTYCLEKYSPEIVSESSLRKLQQNVRDQNLSSVYLAEDTKLNLTNTSGLAMSNISTTLFTKLNVYTASQTSGSQYCWACSIYSAGRYKNPSITLGPTQIALKYAPDLNTPKHPSTIAPMVREVYNVNANYTANQLSYTTLATSILADKPIIAYAYFNAVSGHFITESGYYSGTTNKYVCYMNPTYGTIDAEEVTGTYVTYTNAGGSVCYVSAYIIVG